jgi:hypothetical protein
MPNEWLGRIPTSRKLGFGLSRPHLFGFFSTLAVLARAAGALGWIM